MTREPAEFFGLDVGTLEIGAQADITMLDPAVLKTWDSNDNRIFEHRELFMHKQMLNRSDGVVDTVWIKGEPVWRGGDIHQRAGQQAAGARTARSLARLLHRGSAVRPNCGLK